MTATRRIKRGIGTRPNRALESSQDAPKSIKRDANGVERKRKKVDKGKGRASTMDKDEIPGSFEMVVLGSGGGPLETDVSGYLLKPLYNHWEEGFIALEGGSGIGSLADLIDRHDPLSLFPSVDFPTSHQTAVLKAAHIFSFLSCYLLTHAHLDHCQSLILLSGSMPPRSNPLHGATKSSTVDTTPKPSASLLPSKTTSESSKNGPVPGSANEHIRPPIKVYGTRSTLQKLSLAYGGEIWPELVEWDNEKPEYARRKSLGSQAGSSHHGDGGGPSAEMSLCPLPSGSTSIPLDPALPLTVRQLGISHGCTSKGSYDSTALFIRLVSPTKSTARPNGNGGFSLNENGLDSISGHGREMLFFGDVESSYRPPGAENVDVEGRDRAGECNGRVWKEAAKVWSEGRLAGIFIECSYDSERPPELMFGHMSPLSVMHELGIMAEEVRSLRNTRREHPPLSGLKIYITHIKQYLVPHPAGMTASERIMAQLRELERVQKLGIEFIEVKRGMRIVL